MATKQARIFLWTCCRSLSTSFYRAISNAPGTLGIFEPFYAALRYDGESEADFQDINEKLCQPYIGYTTIFVKAMAFRLLTAPYTIEELLPKGYIHTFLIRDPRKSVTSLYRMFTKRELTGWTTFEKRHGEIKQLYELYTFLTSNLNMKCLIVDADDLMENPESVLTAYCDFGGIQYHQSMVDWSLADSSKLEALKEATKCITGSFFTTATNSRGFIKAEAQSELSNYPPIVKETIEEHMPYYELLYKQRLIVH